MRDGHVRGRGSGGRSLNVGLVTGPVTPSARAAPRTSVVLPDAQLAAHEHHVAVAQVRRPARRPALRSRAGSEVSTMRLTATTRLLERNRGSEPVNATGPREKGGAGRSLLLGGMETGPSSAAIAADFRACTRDFRHSPESPVFVLGNRGQDSVQNGQISRPDAARAGALNERRERLEQAQLIGLGRGSAAVSPRPRHRVAAPRRASGIRDLGAATSSGCAPAARARPAPAAPAAARSPRAASRASAACTAPRPGGRSDTAAPRAGPA